MKILCISDIHLFLHKRVPIFTAVNTELDINTIYNQCAIDYIKECYDSVSHETELEVLFLGDIFDTPYLKEYETYIFEVLLQYITTKHKVKIIVGNHDSSSRKAPNKLKYSSLKYIKTSVEYITDFKIEEYKNNTLFYLSYAERVELYNKLVNVQHLIQQENLYILTHNNFYLTETYNENHMFPINLVKNIYKDKHLTFINGHIHTTYYERGIIAPKLDYFQLGSINPTSFKLHPVAGGILYIDLEDKKNIKSFDNKHIIWSSIDSKEGILPLENMLKQALQYNCTIFLKYPNTIKKYITPLLSKYSVIKGVTEA